MSDNTTPTLRDLFAMAALQSDPHPGTLDSEPDSELDSRAVACYRMADAMQRAREGRASMQPLRAALADMVEEVEELLDAVNRFRVNDGWAPLDLGAQVERAKSALQATKDWSEQ